jgi:N-acetylmuramoyl-L-alanine amidase
VPSTELTVHSDLESYGVLDTARCPAVLCEQCFMNTTADAYWYSDKGCREAAMLYYQAICESFGTAANATLG